MTTPDLTQTPHKAPEAPTFDSALRQAARDKLTVPHPDPVVQAPLDVVPMWTVQDIIQQAYLGRVAKVESRYAQLVRKAKVYKRQLRELQGAINTWRDSYRNAFSNWRDRRMVLEDRITYLEYQLQQAKIQPRYARTYAFLAGCLVGVLWTYVAVIR